MGKAISRTLAIVIVAVIVIAIGAGIYLAIVSQPKEQYVAKMSLGSTVDNLSMVHFATARLRGFYRSEGVNVTYLEVAGGPLAMQALTAGQTDIGYGSLGAILGAIAGGAKLKIIAKADNVGAYQVVVNNEKIKSVGDLKGANWGVESIGGTSYSASIAYLKSIGLSKDDIKWVVVGFQAVRYQALIAKKVDVAMLSVDITTDMSKYPYLSKLVDAKAFSQVVPFLPYGGIVTREEVLKDKPKMVDAVVKAFILASRALARNETLFDETMTRISPPGKFSGGDLSNIYSSVKEVQFAVNGGLNTQKLRAFANHYVTVENPKAADTIKDVMDFVDAGPVRNALKTIGVDAAPWDIPDWYTG